MTLYPVRLTGVHEGLVILHTPAEAETFLRGVDWVPAVRLSLPGQLEHFLALDCECEALCECEAGTA